MELQVLQGDRGQWYIRLIGANGEPMMTSETYDSKANAERAAYNIQNEWRMPIEVRTTDA